MDKIRFAQQVHDSAQSVITALTDYGVTAATLTDLQTKISAADAHLSTSRDAVDARKAATGELKSAVGEFDTLLRHELDPLVESLRDTPPRRRSPSRGAADLGAKVALHPIFAAAALG